MIIPKWPITKHYSAPIGQISCIVNPKSICCTQIKRLIPNARYRGGNSNRFQIGTKLKRNTPNARYRIRNSYRFQIARQKRQIPNTRYRIGFTFILHRSRNNKRIF